VTIIDAHQHVWDLTKASYPWLTADLAPIDRTITFDELKPSLVAAGITGTVLVQSADNAADTEHMFRVAAEHPEVVGVVGYTPLEQPAVVAADLERLAMKPLFVGIRNLIHDIPDPDWLLRSDVDEGLGVLEAAGVPFDLVAVLPRHLQLVPIISERHPGLRIVIDHLAKPPIGRDDPEPWASLMRAAASNPRVFAKVSGLYSSVGESGSWTPASVRPYFHAALDMFGPSRLMYGGDWPISLLSGGYERVWAGFQDLFSELDTSEREFIEWKSANHFYGIESARIASTTHSGAQ
jgi:L-fuconolactonase